MGSFFPLFFLFFLYQNSNQAYIEFVMHLSLLKEKNVAWTHISDVK